MKIHNCTVAAMLSTSGMRSEQIGGNRKKLFPAYSTMTHMGGNWYTPNVQWEDSMENQWEIIDFIMMNVFNLHRYL